MGKKKIVWTETALNDFDRIGAYIALDSIDAASAFTKQVLESAGRLENFPLSGFEVPENPYFRQIIFNGYRVIYRIAEAVEVITVIAPGSDSAQILSLKKK